jgi:hypothetical protein
MYHGALLFQNDARIGKVSDTSSQFSIEDVTQADFSQKNWHH